MTKKAARRLIIPKSLQFRPMAGPTGACDVTDGFMMQIAATIQSMGCGGQHQGWIIGCPALSVALIAGRFSMQTAHKVLAVTVLAIAFGALCGSTMSDTLLVDRVTPNAADSLVLDAAGCENEAQPN